MPGKNHQGFRFSGLTEITPDNVKQLKVAWTFSLGVEKGQEAAPIVADNTMYVVTPYPNIVYALDLTKPGGAVKWKLRAEAGRGGARRRVLRRRQSRRRLCRRQDLLQHARRPYGGASTPIPARKCGARKLGDITRGETMTMAPLVVKGKVLVGNSGGELGVRGWLTALDANTGKIAWRAYSTGPDKDVLIGANFKPFYDQDKGQDLGVHTWPPEAWKIGGGTVWGWISYDPEQNLIYYGTANPGPWNPDQRPGDNKWTAGIFARDPDTGDARWSYQMVAARSARLRRRQREHCSST